MTLRRRLALSYGTVIALILAVALGLAYLIHTQGHDSDVDTALQAIVDDASTDVADEIETGTPLDLVTLSVLHREIDEPIGVSLYRGRQAIARAGYADSALVSTLDLADLSDGWNTTWTPDGRFRTVVSPIAGSDLRLVGVADLSGVDASNEQLRWALFFIWLTGIGIGAAVAAEIAGYALRPVARLTAAAAEIAATRDFHRRVSVERDDADELTTLSRTFDDMLVNLDDAYRQQQRFLGDVSHELRTPLTSISANAELLAAGVTGEEAEAVAQIKRETDRLARLVNGLLVLARSESVEEFAPRPVQLDEVVMEAFEELQPRAPGRLHVRWIEGLRVLGERDRLKQLVVALVDNAIRYTPPPGTVDLSLSNDGHEAVLRIEDQGIGLPPVATERLFERSDRGEEARRLDPSGSGLGRAIVRWIVERHHGSVLLKPNTPRGTRAIVRLPLL